MRFEMISFKISGGKCFVHYDLMNTNLDFYLISSKMCKTYFDMAEFAEAIKKSKFFLQTFAFQNIPFLSCINYIEINEIRDVLNEYT